MKHGFFPLNNMTSTIKGIESFVAFIDIKYDFLKSLLIWKIKNDKALPVN